MTEEKYRFWDTVAKGIGLVGIVASAVFAIYQYRDTRDRELRQEASLKEREFYSQFWNERLQLYLKTLETTSRISAAESPEELAQAIRDFRNLFDGPMAVVQDQEIDRQMHEFAALVEKVERKEMSNKDLGIHSYQLGRRCFESLQGSWDKRFSASAP